MTLLPLLATTMIILIKNMMEQKEQKQIEEEQNVQTNNVIQPKDVTTKDTHNKNILEQKEEQS
jgi:hypothetical protein